MQNHPHWLLLLGLLILTCFIESLSQPMKTSVEIDEYLRTMKELHQIPGLAVAIVNKGEVQYETYMGFASISSADSVDKNTLFRIYSTTKLITSTSLFQLIEQGKVSLEDPVIEYLSHLPNHWKQVKIKHLLTHSSGLPDLIRYEPTLSDKELFAQLFQEKLDFEVGSQFRYNQTNYWLIAQVIEGVSGMSFESFVLKNQFPASNDQVLFSSNSSVSIPHRAHKYEFDYDRASFQQTTNNDGERAHPGNGLNITLPEFIQWNRRLDANEVLSKSTKKHMWSPFLYRNGQDQFLHGWGIYAASDKKSYGFTGGGVSGFRKYLDDDLTIIYLSNGYQYFPVHNYIIDHLAGVIEPSLSNPHSLAEEQVLSAFLQGPFSKAKQIYVAQKEAYPRASFENILNSLGYTLMRMKRMEEAIGVFKLNAQDHPTSWNVFDSLAEGYFENNQLEKAIYNYKKSLELNSDNDNARVMLEEIEKRMKEN